MASIFTRIINREIPGYIVAENDDAIAFLDITPVNEGHTLVVPKKEVDKLFDLDEDTYLKLQSFAQKVAQAIEKAIPCKRVGMAVIGLEVPHAHIHLIPLNSLYDIDFAKPRLKLTQDEFEGIRERIAREI